MDLNTKQKLNQVLDSFTFADQHCINPPGGCRADRLAFAMASAGLSQAERDILIDRLERSDGTGRGRYGTLGSSAQVMLRQ